MRGLAPNLSISGDCTEEWVIVKKITLPSLLPAGWRLWTVKTVSAYEGVVQGVSFKASGLCSSQGRDSFSLIRSYCGPWCRLLAVGQLRLVVWLSMCSAVWLSHTPWSERPHVLWFGYPHSPQSDCPHAPWSHCPHVPQSDCLHPPHSGVPVSNMVYLQQHHILAEMLYRLHGLEGSDLNQSHKARSHVCLHSRRFFLPVEDDYTILTIFSSSSEIWTWNNLSVEGEFDRACPSRVDGRTLTRKLSCFFALKCIALSTKQLQNFPNKCRCQCSTTVHMNPNVKWCFMKSFVFLLPQRKSGLWFSGDSDSFESTFSQFFYYLFRRKSFQGTAKTWQINICNLLLGLIGKTAVSRYSKPEWLWAILLVCTDNLLKYILSFFSFSKGEIKSLKKVFRKRGCCELSLTSFQIPAGCSFLCTVLPCRRQRKMYLVALMLSYILYSLTEP